MAEGAAGFSTGRDPACHTVILITDPAKGPAKLGLLASHTGRLHHLLIGSNEELQLMAMHAFVFSLHLLKVSFLKGSEMADTVVLVETGEVLDGDGAGCGVVGAEEFEQDIRDSFDQEGRAAFKGTTVDFLPDI
jgi:hypothetical protein